MEIIESECFHGIPLINGRGCALCSGIGTRIISAVSIPKVERESARLAFLEALPPDKYDVVEIPIPH